MPKRAENSTYPILIHKNTTMLLGRFYNQTVYVNEESLPVTKYTKKFIGSMLDVRIIKSNQNSLLGVFRNNA